MSTQNDNALITIADAKASLQITTSDYDGVLERIIQGVTTAIESYLGRAVCKRTVVAEKIDGDGTDTLLLNAPIISIDSIINDTVTVSSADYVLYPKPGFVRLTDGTVWDSRPQKVTVSYKHGWEIDLIPQDIMLAASIWVNHLFLLIDKDRIGVAAKTSGDETITYIQGMPTDVRGLLDPYRMGRL